MQRGTLEPFARICTLLRVKSELISHRRRNRKSGGQVDTHRHRPDIHFGSEERGGSHAFVRERGPTGKIVKTKRPPPPPPPLLSGKGGRRRVVVYKSFAQINLATQGADNGERRC